MSEQLHTHFRITADHVRIVGEALITEHFGDRCPEFEPGCEVCRRWGLLDRLIVNPYSEEDVSDECCVCGDRDDLYRSAGKVYCHHHLAVSEGGDE